MNDSNRSNKQLIDQERREILQQIEAWLEKPMIVLGFVWTALIIVEYVWGSSSILNIISDFIWFVFILEFTVRLLLAPQKLNFLKHNWIAALSLLLPALRIFRIANFVRILGTGSAVRGIQLLRVLARTNRGMKTLSTRVQRRGVGYVIALTLLIVLVGAAGMLEFERNVPETTLTNYGNALWWTAMVMTTMGSDYFPKTAEGRVLCFLLAVYAFAVFGYVTATVATFFIGQDADNEASGIASEKTLQALQAEIAALREELRIDRASTQK